MWRAIHYLLASWRHPRRRPYIDMGLGIAARAERCQGAWRGHLSCCREFQRLSFQGMRERSNLAILGCGRLLDVAIDDLTEQFGVIDCFDADPTVRSAVERWATQAAAKPSTVRFFDEDITGCFDSWSTTLMRELEARQRAGRTSAIVAGVLRELRVPPAPTRSYSVVISLNILSQLKLYWRDRVEQLVTRYLGVSSDEQGKLPEPLEDALHASCRELEYAHLDLLRKWAAERIVLITDTDWLYYDRSKSLWQCESALCVDLATLVDRGLSRDAISGNSSVGTDETRAAAAEWGIRHRDQWLWHIAPQGIENSEYGVIHDVRAFEYERYRDTTAS